MIKYNIYLKYKKYRDGVFTGEVKRGDLLRTGEYLNLEDCEKEAQYKWEESTETVCDNYSLYAKDYLYSSTDKGGTWTKTDVSRKGKLLESNSTACGWHIMEVWKDSGETACDGYNLSIKLELYKSYDMGKTWEATGEFKFRVREEYSEECVLKTEPLIYEISASDKVTTFYKVFFNNLSAGPKTMFFSYADKQIQSRYTYKLWILVDDTPIVIRLKSADSFQTKAVDWLYGFPVGHVRENAFNWPVRPEKIEDPIAASKYALSHTVKIWGNISQFNDETFDVVNYGAYSIKLLLLPTPSFTKAMIPLKIEHDEIGNADLVRQPFTYGNLDTLDLIHNGNLPLTGDASSIRRLYLHNMSTIPAFYFTPQLLLLNVERCGLDYIPDLPNNKFWAVKCTECPNLKRVPDIFRNPDGVISEYAFYGCTGLTEFPDNMVMNVQNAAFMFYGCTNLQKDNNLTINCLQWSHGASSGVLDYPQSGRLSNLEYMFSGCEKLQYVPTITLFESEWWLDFKGATHMFFNCTSLTNLTESICNTLFPKLMGDNSYMFYNCPNITTVYGEFLVLHPHTLLYSMFEKSGITHVPALFKNIKKYFPDMDNMFANCKVVTIADEFINPNFESNGDKPWEKVTRMFANNPTLTNYPKAWAKVTEKIPGGYEISTKFVGPWYWKTFKIGPSINTTYMFEGSVSRTMNEWYEVPDGWK